jgi:hypothetical protein
MENILERENTVVHLICTTNEWHYAFPMLESIAAQNAQGHTAVVACIETQLKNHRQLMQDNNFLPGMPPQTVMTAVYELTAEDGRGKWVLIKALEDFNMRFHVHLTDFFKEMVIGKNPAKRYLLFTWGHGSTYAIFSQPGTVVQDAVPGPGISHLTSADLARAIGDCSTDEKVFKIAVVIMINCYMQQIEAGYELSLVETEYFVAPENFGSWEGYNYGLLFNQLFSAPNIPSEAFARLAVDSLQGYDPPDAQGTASSSAVLPLNTSAFVAINLQLYKELFNLMHALSKSLLTLADADIAKFLLDAFSTPATSRNRSIDLVALLRVMKNSFNHAHTALHDNIDRILQLLSNKSVVVSLFIGKNKAAVPYNGISINYVQESILATSHHHLRFMRKASPFACTFVKDNAWGDFTEKYIPLLP